MWNFIFQILLHFFSLPKPLGKVSNALLDDDHPHRSPNLLQGVMAVVVVVVVVEMPNVFLVTMFRFYVFNSPYLKISNNLNKISLNYFE
jgi:hypothetical protein